MATSSDVKMKKEPGEDVKEVLHNHRFYIQFESGDHNYEINCKAPQTVLEAINSIDQYALWSDEKLVIQRTMGLFDFTVVTHFPCCLIKEDEKLIVSQRLFKVKEARQNRIVLPKESYSVFYIDSEGTKNTKTWTLLISSQRQGLKPLCVYGKKEITAKEALERDGRFKTFSRFSLIDCNNRNVLKSSDTISDLRDRKFKIELHIEKPAKAPKKSKSPRCISNVEEQTSDMEEVLDLAKQRGISVMEALKGRAREEILKILRKKFPELKELILSRFPADSFQKELSVRDENFGKMRQSFSEVHTMKNLISLGELVCKVVVEDICTGTGFVLFDNYIMTNAHLFKMCTDGDRLKKGVDVHVIFNYEVSSPEKHELFKVEDALIYYIEDELNYAVLQVNPEALAQSEVQFPSGLLERVGEMPENGEACIIGHPGGEGKQINLTSIIGMEKREQAVLENLRQYKDKPYALFVEQVKNQGIGRIMVGGADAGKVITYNSFMYHGASGSPVFDVDGSLCGLHTGGFVCGPPKATESVIEFAYPMKTIITHFVMTLHEKNLTDLLQRMKDVAGSNAVLREIFGLIN